MRTAILNRIKNAALILLLAGMLALGACAGGPRKTLDQYVSEGNVTAAESDLSGYLSMNKEDDPARFELGCARVLKAFERLAQKVYGYGIKTEGDYGFFFSLPIPPNPSPREIRYADFRNILREFRDDLDTAAKTLAAIRDDRVKVPLHFGLIRLDLNGDGRREEWEAFWSLYSRFLGASEVTEAAARDFIIGFDRGDAYWLEGYLNLMEFLLDTILAHDWEMIWSYLGRYIFVNASPLVDLPDNYLGDDFLRKVLDFKVVEAGRLETSLSHILKVVQLSRASFSSILAESDNDHEWIPNPGQDCIFPGIKLSREMIDGWFSFLDEVEAIFEGRKLVPLWMEFEGKNGLNLKKFMLDHKEINIMRLFAEGGIAEYMEKGDIVDADKLSRLAGLFQGNFFYFMAWFN